MAYPSLSLSLNKILLNLLMYLDFSPSYSAGAFYDSYHI